MHDIANGSKYFILTRPKLNMSGSSIENSYIEQDYAESGYFDDELLIIFDDNSSMLMNILLRTIVSFWSNYFSEK